MKARKKTLRDWYEMDKGILIGISYVTIMLIICFLVSCFFFLISSAIFPSSKTELNFLYLCLAGSFFGSIVIPLLDNYISYRHATQKLHFMELFFPRTVKYFMNDNGQIDCSFFRETEIKELKFKLQKKYFVIIIPSYNSTVKINLLNGEMEYSEELQEIFTYNQILEFILSIDRILEKEYLQKLKEQKQREQKDLSVTIETIHQAIDFGNVICPMCNEKYRDCDCEG